MKSEKNFESLLDRKDIPEEVKDILIEYFSEGNQRRIENESKLNQARKVIQGEQEKLKLIMDNIPHHIFWKDLNSKYLGCNKNYARAIGLNKPEDIIGKRESDFHWTDDEVRSFLESDRRVIETGKSELQTILQVIRIDGSIGIYEANKVPLFDGTGKLIGTLGTSQDISSRIALENQLKQTKLEEERYHSMMGHFNRNDLQKITAYLEYLANTYKLKNKLDLTVVDAVKDIVTQSSIVIETVDKIFEVIKTPPFSIRRATYQNVSTLLDICISKIARFKKIPIDVHINKGSLNVKLASDKYLIDAFSQLLSYILISDASNPEIHVMASNTYQGFAITIQDNLSKPIEEEISSLLTGKITDRWEYQGHYIGISYVSVIMNHYRGSLKIIPLMPSGNKFVLTFPNSLLETKKSGNK
jgi:PAS domain S-box-containing protein